MNFNFFSFFICLVLLFFIDPLSILSMGIFVCLGLLLYRLFFIERNYTEYLFAFSIFTIMAIVIYWTNITAFPANFGCTGAELGGTDDLYFFQEATNHGISYRGDRSDFMHSYSILLEKFHFLISTFKRTNLIDLMFVNILSLSFIPIFTKRITFFFTKNEKAAKFAFYLAVSSPFLIQHSLVLVRDGITAALFIGIFYFYLNRKYLFMVLFFILLSYLRIISGGLSVFFILAYIYFSGNRTKLIKYVLLFSIIFYVFLPAIITNLENTGVLGEGLFRQGYFEVIKEGSSEDSGAVLIYSLPIYLRIPFGTLYFIGTPFINLKSAFSSNLIYIWPNISLLYGVFFIFYIVYVVRAVFAKKNHILTFLWLIFIAISVLFSQISLEVRHKTLIMPLLFIIVAISFYTKTSNKVKYFSLLIAFLLFSLQVIYNLINFI